jgi:hypothetical protein
VRRTPVLPILALAVAGSLLLASPAAAQAVPGPGSSALWAPASSPPFARSILPDSARKKDHTVTGLLIGAGVGFAAGWAFYDVICEAVDNRCSDSRLPLLVLGTGLGAGLGALIGSAVD